MIFSCFWLKPNRKIYRQFLQPIKNPRFGALGRYSEKVENCHATFDGEFSLESPWEIYRQVLKSF